MKLQNTNKCLCQRQDHGTSIGIIFLAAWAMSAWLVAFKRPFGNARNLETWQHSTLRKRARACDSIPYFTCSETRVERQYHHSCMCLVYIRTTLLTHLTIMEPSIQRSCIDRWLFVRRTKHTHHCLMRVAAMCGLIVSGDSPRSRALRTCWHSSWGCVGGCASEWVGEWIDACGSSLWRSKYIWLFDSENGFLDYLNAK